MMKALRLNGRTLIAALAVLLLLGGCHRAAGPAVTPTPTPEPTETVKELWGFPMDDTHDAFEVDTKGTSGTVLVTVERGEENAGELGGYHYTLSVWNKDDLTTPVQTMEEIAWSFGDKALVDADFDGHTDFLCVWDHLTSINWPSSLYIWDEDQGQFVYKTTLVGRGVGVDEKTRSVRNRVHYTNYSGAEEIYRWENGELVCMREVEITYPTGSGEDLIELIVQDNVGGEMAEIYRKGFSEEGVVWDESYKWYDPDYYESVWGFPVDDTHDAFLVPTKGALGTVLVTVEMENEAAQELHFSVRTKDDLDKPIQTMTAQRVNVFHWHQEQDINFDGYGDFTYQWMLGKNAGSSTLWLWDEKAQKFVEEPEYANIPNPWADPETQTISGIITYTNAGDGEETFYRWENGELVCWRKEVRTYPEENWEQEKIIYERVNGELVETSREPLVMLG